MTLTVTTTHTKTLIAPDSGVEDKVYGSDYVSLTSHTSVVAGTLPATSVTGLATIATSGAITDASGILLGAHGGTGSANFTVAGPTAPRTMTFPDASATVARTDAANTFTGIQTFSTPIAVGSVATMTATVGGGVPTPPNNTTTFLRGDGTFAAPTASVTWDTINAAAGSATTANGNNTITYNTAHTSDSSASWTFGETSAATNGTVSGGFSNQRLLVASTLAASTQSPFTVITRGNVVMQAASTATAMTFANGGVSQPSIVWANALTSGIYYDTTQLATVIAKAGIWVTGFTSGGASRGQMFPGDSTLSFANPWITDFSTGTSGIVLNSTILGISIGGTENSRFVSGAFQPRAASSTNLGAASLGWGALYLDYTNTATVGSVTINKPSGTVNIAALGSTLTLTNSLITANSHLMLTLASDPGVALAIFSVCGAGSATITTRPAVVGQTAVDFVVCGAD